MFHGNGFELDGHDVGGTAGQYKVQFLDFLVGFRFDDRITLDHHDNGYGQALSLDGVDGGGDDILISSELGELLNGRDGNGGLNGVAGMTAFLVVLSTIT